MAHFIFNGQPTNLIEIPNGGQVSIQLWGDDPNAARLIVTPSDPTVVRVDEVQASFGNNIRGFLLRGLRQGSVRLHARAGSGERYGQIRELWWALTH